MEGNRFDLVVIGAGIAGLTAAALATAESRKVALVSIGVGSLAQESCTMGPRQLEALPAEDDLDRAIGFFQEMCASAGCAFDGDRAQVCQLPTLMGSLQPAVLASRTVLNSALRAEQPTLIAGIGGLSGFDAQFLAEQLNRAAHTLDATPVFSATRIALPIALGIPVTAVRMAQAFDRDAAFRELFAASLHSAAKGFARVLLPGVLGLYSTDAQLAEFERMAGCQLGELPTLPPSIPGLRLYNRLIEHLRAQGIEFFAGYPVNQLEIADGVCTSVSIASPGRSHRLRAGAVILASSVGCRALLKGELDVDQYQRPINAQHVPVAHNLFAGCTDGKPGAHARTPAGRILAGYCAAANVCARKEEYAAR